MYPKNSEVALSEDQLLKGELEPTNEGYALAKCTITNFVSILIEDNSLFFKTVIPCNLYGKYDNFDLRLLTWYLEL